MSGTITARLSNMKRLHSSLGYRTPQEVHDDYYKSNPAA